MRDKHLTLLDFIGVKVYNFYFGDWNYIMAVVDKIEKITGCSIEISNSVHIYWWYSKKKTGTFKKGFGGVGGNTIKRKPFDTIFGKEHDIYCYYQKDREFKVRKNETAEDKKEAVVNACYRFIKWYNKTVKK